MSSIFDRIRDIFRKQPPVHAPGDVGGPIVTPDEARHIPPTTPVIIVPSDPTPKDVVSAPVDAARTVSQGGGGGSTPTPSQPSVQTIQTTEQQRQA